MDGTRHKFGSPESGKKAAGASPNADRTRQPNTTTGSPSSSKSAPAAHPVAWFSQGSDFCYYGIAQRALDQSRKKVSKLALVSDERLLLIDIPSNAIDVVEKLKVIREDREKVAKRHGVSPRPQQQTRTTEFCVKFSEFVSRIYGVADTLTPLSPGYAFVFGLLMIIFKGIVTRRDREETFFPYLDSLTVKLPPPDFYKKTSVSSAMKQSVVTLYCGILTFVDEALMYYQSGRLAKLLDVVLPPVDIKLTSHMAQIEADIKKMEAIPKSNQDVPAMDAKMMASPTGRIFEHLSQNLERATTVMSMNIELLNQRLNGLEVTVNQTHHFGMVQYARSLKSALSANPMDIHWENSDSLSRVLDQTPQLATHDHWENNGVLETLENWARARHHIPMLWIGGQSAGQTSWVTDFSVDLVQALMPQPVTLLYIFCADLASCSIPPTPMRLLKSLITQILDQHPELSYEDPTFFSVARFQHSATFRLRWHIFEVLVEKLNDVFIVFDRIEECVPDDHSDLTTHLLPELMQLMRHVPGTKCIATSIYDPPDEVIDQEEDLESTFIDTSIALRIRAPPPEGQYQNP